MNEANRIARLVIGCDAEMNPRNPWFARVYELDEDGREYESSSDGLAAAADDQAGAEHDARRYAGVADDYPVEVVDEG